MSHYLLKVYIYLSRQTTCLVEFYLFDHLKKIMSCHKHKFRKFILINCITKTVSNCVILDYFSQLEDYVMLYV